MALQDIVQKIIDDATAEAEARIAAAKTEAETLLARSESQVQQECDSLEKAGAEKIIQLHKKIDNLGRHQQKANILQAKRNMLTQAFDMAKEKIAALPAAQKEEILLEMFHRIDATEGTVHPTQGEEKVVEAALKQSKKPFDMGKSVSGKGGFLLVTPTSEMDFRFDALVDRELSSKLEGEISSLLFAA